MRPGRAARKHGGIRRLDCHNLHPRLFALQILAHAGNRTARAHAGHENIHAAVRILPDFRAGGLAVRIRVGGVGKLAGDEAPGDLRGQFLGFGDGSVHALSAFA